MKNMQIRSYLLIFLDADLTPIFYYSNKTKYQFFKLNLSLVGFLSCILISSMKVMPEIMIKIKIKIEIMFQFKIYIKNNCHISNQYLDLPYKIDWSMPYNMWGRTIRPYYTIGQYNRTVQYIGLHNLSTQ